MKLETYDDENLGTTLFTIVVRHKCSKQLNPETIFVGYKVANS